MAVGEFLNYHGCVKASVFSVARTVAASVMGLWFASGQATAADIPLGSQTLGFGSGGPFTGWTDNGGGDLVRGGGPNTQQLSFNIWDETATTAAGVLAGPGGAADFTIRIDLIDPFNPYNGAPFRPAKSTTHDVKQPAAGFLSTTPWANNADTSANRGRTGDTAGARITVTFANHLTATASSFGVGMTSVNTAGSAFESSATVFRWAGGIGYAAYNGYYATPPLGPAPTNQDGLQQTWVVGTDPWATATGAYAIDATGTISVSGLNARTISSGSNGLMDNATVSALSAGVSAGSFIKGFEWYILLEDVRGLDADGDGTISVAEFATGTDTSTSFTATLTQMTGSFLIIPEPSKAGLLGAALLAVAGRRRRA
jgi:hypothetical protein